MIPRVLGDAQNVVAVIHVDLHGLWFLASELPQSDGFTRMLLREYVSIQDELDPAPPTVERVP